MRILRSLFTLCLILFLLTITSSKDQFNEQLVPKLVKVMTLDSPPQFEIHAIPRHIETLIESPFSFLVGDHIFTLLDKGSSHIQKRELLARLDPRNFQKNLERALAKKQSAIVNKNRISQALNTEAVSKQDLAEATERVKIANALVNIRRRALEDSVIKGPFDGAIAWTFKEDYQRVHPTEIIMHLVNKETIFGDVGTVARAFTFTHAYPMSLTISQKEETRILPKISDSAVSTVKTINIEGVNHVHEIPLSSIVVSEDSKARYVWIVNKDDMTVQKREITLEEITARGIRVKGLQTGQTIVTAGVHLLKNNQKIRLK